MNIRIDMNINLNMKIDMNAKIDMNFQKVGSIGKKKNSKNIYVNNHSMNII